MDSLEKTGKTVSDAVRDALSELNAIDEEVEIEVLDEGSKGFIGIGGRPAKVRVTLKHDPVRVVKSFIRDIAAAIGVRIDVEAELSEKQLYVNMTGDNMGIFIGKRGQTLDALQYIVNLAVNKGDAQYLNVTLDTEDYRKRRKETLEALARNLAKKVKMTKTNVTLEPMSPYERRIIHSALQNDRYVTTFSEGEDPYRNVVISLRKDGAYVNKKPYETKKPYGSGKPYVKRTSYGE